MTARQNLLDWLVLVYGKLALNKEIVIGVKDTQVSVFILFTILLIYKTWFISEDNIELDAKFKLNLNA
jgi:hypothetical protein